MKLQILFICCLSLKIQSQSLKPTRTYNNYQGNPETLYFSDNIPSNLNVKNSNLQREYEDSQRNALQRELQAANDSYLRAQQALQNIRNQNLSQTKILNNPPNLNQNQNQNLNPNQNQNFLLNQNLNPNQNQNHLLNQNLNFNPNQNQNIYNPFPNRNQNVNHQDPSLEVLPPLQGSPDYYNNVRRNALQKQQLEENVEINRSSEVDVVPLTRNVTQDDVRKVTLATTYIGIHMMKKATESQSNAVVSPLSVVNMLALLQAASSGETQRQISDALRMTPEMSASVFQLLNTEIRKRGATRNLLKTASAIFAEDAIDLSSSFKNFAIRSFDSEISKLSFANPNLAAKTINEWIARKTNDQIKNLVSPDSVDINTRIVLANAVFFKGIWETMFKRESTTDKDFRLSNGQKKSHPFMSLRSSIKCGVDASIQSLVAVLPFEGNQYSLVLLLPLPNSSVQAVLESLNGDKLLDYQNIRKRDTLIEIPKFTVRSNTDLYPIFNSMGITKMFSAASELTNLAGQNSSPPPQVSSAIHTAMMSVDEQGATAAASTVVAVVALSYDLPSYIFRADRPFLAILWDSQLNVPLFMTKIDNPSL